MRDLFVRILEKVSRSPAMPQQTEFRIWVDRTALGGLVGGLLGSGDCAFTTGVGAGGHLITTAFSNFDVIMTSITRVNGTDFFMVFDSELF